MSTFSFTISASDVNSLKNTSGQSAFEATADRGMSRASTHRTLTAKFGDGYEQRVLDGINTKDDSFSISFNNRAAEDINLIAAFFDDRAAKSFNFTVTDTFTGGSLSNRAMKVVCDTYNIVYLRENFHSLTCTLRRVYEP
jgi:phage-related protein